MREQSATDEDLRNGGRLPRLSRRWLQKSWYVCDISPARWRKIKHPSVILLKFVSTRAPIISAVLNPSNLSLRSVVIILCVRIEMKIRFIRFLWLWSEKIVEYAIHTVKLFFSFYCTSFSFIFYIHGALYAFYIKRMLKRRRKSDATAAQPLCCPVNGAL